MGKLFLYPGECHYFCGIRKWTRRLHPAQRAAYRRNGFPCLDHFAADAGIVYPMATYPQQELTPAEIQRIADVAGRLLWSGAFDHYNFELVDSDHTPLENLRRYRVLILPNPQAGEDATQYPHLGQYSEKAQHLIADYVAGGGTLVVLPSKPGGLHMAGSCAPFGSEQFIPGPAPLQFTDGSQATAVGGVYAIAPPEKSALTVFARDAQAEGSVGHWSSAARGSCFFLVGISLPGSSLRVHI